MINRAPGLHTPSLSVTKVIIFCLENELFILAIQYVIKTHWPLTKELQLKIRTPKHLDYKQTQLKMGREKSSYNLYICLIWLNFHNCDFILLLLTTIKGRKQTKLYFWLITAFMAPVIASHILDSFFPTWSRSNTWNFCIYHLT
jgi:hypothetical protein